MKPVLAIDTATSRATLAAGPPGTRPADVLVAAKRDLSRVIDAAARDALRHAGIAPADLGAVIVADGPGSFTGLRIGIAFAKGLARALHVPLLTAPSLLGAARARQDGPGEVAAEYDALRGEVYRAVYRFGADGAVRVVQAPALAVAAAADTPSGTPTATEVHASAASLVRLAGVPGGTAVVGDPDAWDPAYGRPAEAEARRLAAHARRAGA